jgi:uncharacterized phage protein gp47/JayE
MPTYPLPTLAATVSSTGISAPSYSDVYQSLIATFQAIYGADIYISADSQDGQWLAALAQAINDSNQAAVAVFNSFSPVFAQGAGLSSLVKINGLQRLISTHSQAVGNVVGVVGTVITSGVVQDSNGQLWDIPATITIPAGGSIAITVLAENPGSISAGIGVINKIATPQLGWQSFTNTSAATAGSPVESDATLKARQTVSVAYPAQAILDGIAAAIANVPGVTRYQVYENATGAADANGAPGHCIYPVVEGGDITAIAQAIANRKTPGGQTYGTTSVALTRPLGLQAAINFYVLAYIPVYFSLTIKSLPGYVATTGNSIIAALVAFANGLEIGDDVYISQAQAIASMGALGLGDTFYITAFTLGTAPAPVGVVNIPIAFNYSAQCATANVVLTTT